MTLCPQCSTFASILLETRDYNRHLSSETFTYYRCPSCQLIFLSPVPENLSDFYPPAYYSLPDHIDEYLPQIAFQRYKIDLVKQFITEGRLLEIGPGPGDFAVFAKQAGFQVEAIEMDKRCCQFLNEVIGVNAIDSADVLSVLDSLGEYQVIALWQVIEHLPNPWSILDVLPHHIAPGGILLIATPNPESLQFRLFGQYWAHLDAPRHLQLIPIDLLNKRLRNTGLRPILQTTSPGTHIYNRFGWQQSPQNRFRRNLPMRYPGAIINRLIAPLERTGWRGSTYTAIFQK